jgi:predicted nucleotidyltransferase
MPNKKIEKIIEDVNKAILNKFSFFKGSYFYGSRARGKFTKDSDIDLINVFDKELSYEEELELAGIIGDIDYKYDVFIDYHDYTLDNLKRNPIFYNEVVNKGFYYEAA